ncbi:MAG: hypothetical protein HZB13_01895 [Acidobacteria bacterium]|nr:hypothetical protein [Acidobacteriota bacterium]
MNFRLILLLVAMLTSVLASAEACEPRSRKQVRVEGAITAVQQGQIDVSMGRRTETLLITENTRIFQGRVDVDASTLRTGDRVVAQVVRLKSGELEAREIRSTDSVERTPSSPSPANGGHKH